MTRFENTITPQHHTSTLVRAARAENESARLARLLFASSPALVILLVATAFLFRVI